MELVVPSLPRIKTSTVVPSAVSASLDVCCISPLVLFFGGLPMAFISFLLSLPPQSESNWCRSISCTVAYAAIRANGCAKPVSADREPAVGFRDFGSGTESCQSGSYGSGTKISRKAIVAVN